MVFTTAARTVYGNAQSATERIFMPNGKFLDDTTPLSSLLDSNFPLDSQFEGLDQRLRLVG